METKTVNEYKKMSIKELLDLRHNPKTPTEELHKILNALEEIYPLGVCHCRAWVF